MNHKERAFDMAAQWLDDCAGNVSSVAFIELVKRVAQERKNAWAEGWASGRTVDEITATGTPPAEDSDLAEALWNLVDRWEGEARSVEQALGRFEDPDAHALDVAVWKAEAETKIALHRDAAFALGRLLSAHKITCPQEETK